MRFEWDEQKNRSNQGKHQVSFELASEVFDDPYHQSRQDRIEDGEMRGQTVGLVGGMALLLVAHTWHDDDGEVVVRIISARKATRAERRAYEVG